MARYVAWAVSAESADRREIAAVIGGDGDRLSLLFLLGYDDLAVKALGHVAPEARMIAIEDPTEALAQVIAVADEAPWVGFDLEQRFGDLATSDESGAWRAAWEGTDYFDVGDLAAMALPLAAAEGPLAFLAAAGLPSLGDALPAELAAAMATATLWEAMPELLGRLPTGLRLELPELFERGASVYADVWRQVKPAHDQLAEGEPRRIESFLRARMSQLLTDQEPREAPESLEPIELKAVVAVFADDGPLARLHPAYEQRQGQVQMARQVAEALNGSRCLLVEAGTGTGKSLAYLVPALLFAYQNGCPVVISTNTKNLQDQLEAKDLPLLREALDVEFNAVLLKGRANYLCVDRLCREVLDSGLLLHEDHFLFLACLCCWAAVTERGDFDELSHYLVRRHPGLLPYARTLSSTPDYCGAPHLRGHPCFASLARSRAQAADLLVVNHALVLANASVEVLPPFSHLIFDEAHNLEDIATEVFGRSFDRPSLVRLLREVRPGRDQRLFLPRLRAKFANVAGEETDALRKAADAVEAAAQSVEDGIERFGEQLSGLALHLLKRRAGMMERTERVRLRPESWAGQYGQAARLAGENLGGRLTMLVKALTTVVVQLGQAAGETDASGAAGRGELHQLWAAAQQVLSDWSEVNQALTVVLDPSDEALVYWLEFQLRRADEFEWWLRAAPIHAGEALAEQIHQKMDSVIMTSATLTIDGSFDYFANRLGLAAEGLAERTETLLVRSEFDYRRQVLLGLPLNIALPTEERFDQNVTKAVKDVATLLEGRTLVLFTSLRQMRLVWEGARSHLAQHGIEALCQGQSGPRHALADRLRADARTVLFGTRSFWEGIDVPGDALRCVILVKLPFAVPDDPVVAARCEWLEARGQNAWNNYSVPQAVIAFKQGFGRLIRSATDRGVVICLDRRLHERSYGRAFLRSVPGYNGVFDNWSQVLDEVSEWFAEGGKERRR